MRVFMFVNYSPFDQSLGITKKIGAEITALKRLGNSVVFTAYKTDGIGIYDNQGTEIFTKNFVVKSKKFQGVIRYFMLLDTVLEFLKANHDFDIFYGRLLAPNHKYIRMLRTFKKYGCKIILEAHAYFPGIKFKSIKGRYVSLMLNKNGPKLSGLVDRILTEGHIDDFYGIKEVIETRIGVDTNKITPHQYCGSEQQLNLISVANEIAYHGYDRLIKSLGRYYQDNCKAKDIRIHFVGEITDSTKELVKELDLQDKIIFHGKQFGDKLDIIYNQCNLGVGPLGQHRIGGKKDTGLKTKEYFAKGIPYIFAGDEPTVPDNYPYICKFISDESMIDFEKIWAFYQSYVNDEHVVQNMREFASKTYSWDKIMEEALSGI